MFIIAGLGNPTPAYEGTRHNVGFDVIDAIAEKYTISMDGRKCRAFVGKGVVEGQKVMLVKPQTYMNLSGESIGRIAEYFKIDPARELLVIYDDICLPPGQIRIREKGSAGGHNGMKSIIAHLGTEAFPRIKVGIGEKPKHYELADYVLSRFGKEERSLVEEACGKAEDAAVKILKGGIKEAMNVYNRKVKPLESPQEA